MSAQHTPGPFTVAEQVFIDRMATFLIGTPTVEDVLKAAARVNADDKRLLKRICCDEAFSEAAKQYMAPRVYERAVVKESFTTRTRIEAICGEAYRQVQEATWKPDGRPVSYIDAAAGSAA